MSITRFTKRFFILYPSSFVLLFALVAFSAPAIASEHGDGEEAEEIVLETDAQKIGYAWGVQIGRQFRQANEGMDMKAFEQGFKDALAEEERMSNEELRAVMTSMNQRMREAQMAEQRRAVTENLEKAEAFLAENKDVEGVVTTESGLQYTVLEPAEGAKPTAASTVRVHYRGTLLDGSQFDSSYDRGQPTEFPLSGVIRGWTEGLQYMPVGSKYRFWIHPDMAYGSAGRPGIPANSLLIFEVELLEIK